MHSFVAYASDARSPDAVAGDYVHGVACSVPHARARDSSPVWGHLRTLLLACRQTDVDGPIYAEASLGSMA